MYIIDTYSTIRIYNFSSIVFALLDKEAIAQPLNLFMIDAIFTLLTAFWDTTMKSLSLTYLLTVTLLMTGCQSFQFVDSPIPVKNIPIPATTISVQNNAP